ncbi:hypothetical protein A3H80_00205 [Candidatus Roizmanbacteria bacterium RIFCSPLOWO2_02_FULL_37_19]|uniref:UDP-N-acetylmuramyl-tripeptide synthetase n=1 Tax=Candidatus Roizmanbacteria bacterium RIFCSPHIGHO2_02_FULL_37_24 TaxID=1802037 RepID=A0A1F7GZ66_9BACT|nr:MAG: hypothetical protein A2862_01590 [Candidatus Roizmanbacteria bacterium RIFCSPHIGHO2_01_FULL_38_41]OGK24417.1 MAG: hypothetical protein A3C24_01915 [Candidatus Roizmanbacteria bacterium RIFCSPHIGHO2_02_FULL_37_24]OGK32631.1 MAG: hypothetical protein A3E10_01385 [Candidatus Roizmanbacteria bacterium RIFCSPHIGHO2_12_FULL_37_23]OGK53945.1 MAG: hypothetical protein A3H80_00205 [Candidatus Roizmanbacteria bacterium RIFCSPLOWO2_02_FULL_37_19]OGK61608.1 MAG: hypothetical protein A3G65_01345 [Ca
MVFQFLKNTFHIFECLAADIFYGFPGRKLTIIGVTGTDGKTTTVHLIYHILKSVGKPVSMISSIYADIGGKIAETGFHVTTPRPWQVRRYLKSAREAGSTHFVLETTSHAIEQNRIWGINFATSVITNVSHEHLYHHKSLENYIKIKTSLLIHSREALINKDTQSFDKITEILQNQKKDYKTFSLKNSDADFTWNSKIKTKIKGDFNKENILAAYSICLTLGMTQREIMNAITSFELPKGRLERVYDRDFKVIIDFAHTPHALERLLETVRKEFIKKNGRIIHVFGAASERDDSKRPEMGEASGKYADIIILTEEDYRKENIITICDQIAQGLKGYKFIKDKNYFVIADRSDAIEKAVMMAKKGDAVVVTGKSHERSLNRGGKEYPWDEYKAVRKALILKK